MLSYLILAFIYFAIPSTGCRFYTNFLLFKQYPDSFLVLLRLLSLWNLFNRHPESHIKCDVILRPIFSVEKGTCSWITPHY